MSPTAKCLSAKTTCSLCSARAGFPCCCRKSVQQLLCLCAAHPPVGDRGGDVLPSRYGEETLPACGEDDPQRDIFELLIIPMAIARNMPIFGICRGIQVLNVAMGGTLIQDIESQQNIPKKTHQKEPFSQLVHTVRFEKGSIFERITGATEIKANSMHHQAIKKPADGLQVDGHSEDGIIEAMSAKDGSRIFAVQFHPEYLSDHDAHAQRLFDHFVKLSREYQSEKEA